MIGAVVITVTDPDVTAAFNFFSAARAAFEAAWRSIATAYGALFSGSLGSPRDHAGSGFFSSTGDDAAP